MSHRILTVGGVVAVAIALAACQVSKSANPLSPSVAGPIPGVNITAPKIMAPQSGSEIPVDQQPLTLTVGNASTSGVRPLTYVFDVGADAGFTNVVFTRPGIAPGDGGQTSLQLPDPLAAAGTYYWRAHAEDGANTGPYSAAAAFKVFVPVVIQAPVPLAPINNIVADSVRPSFLFVNAQKSGPAGPINYLGEVSDNQSFASKIVTWTSSEQGGQTSVPSPQDLPFSKQLYWHVRAADPTVTGPWSATQTFQTPAPAPVIPPPPPPGGGGGGPITINGVNFDHAWTGKVELQLQALLASGLARPDGSNGQAVVDKMNALGGIYAGAEFQPHHNGVGDPTYGFGWFYVSYITSGPNARPDGRGFYQIVEYGMPPPGD
ncbi:MAG TPA: hypothetical protein VGZ27_00430 [Vicinamibacterales bacterium]|jgi:hypothetical protein|nr:hypothetical protein [Vicinamibacterales bacterium]